MKLLKISIGKPDKKLHEMRNSGIQKFWIISFFSNHGEFQRSATAKNPVQEINRFFVRKRAI